jgi:hypothetical protein
VGRTSDRGDAVDEVGADVVLALVDSVTPTWPPIASMKPKEILTRSLRAMTQQAR